MDDDLFEYTDGEYLQCYDPDVDYEILDDNESYLENASQISSTSRTTTTEGTIIDNDYDIKEIFFDHAALSHAKSLAISNFEGPEQEETDIDWLAVDGELPPDVESLWASTTEDSNTNDYEIESKAGVSYDQCVIIDYKKGHIQRCTNPGYRPIKQLIGVWELDFQTLDTAVRSGTEDALNTLGICSDHFSFDQNKLHIKGSKQHVLIDKSWIHRRRCMFCNSDKYFFSRGGCCTQHLWKVFGQNVCIPCVGLKVCPAFNEDNEFVKSDTSQSRGHIYQRRGKGFVPFTCVDMHNNDNQKSLHFLGQLIQEMAINLDQQLQTILLKEIWLAVVNFLKKKANSSKGETISQDLQIKPPTYFGIKVALRMKKVNLHKLEEKTRISSLITDQPHELGSALGMVLWKSRSEVHLQKNVLEAPKTLQEFHTGFPKPIRELFDNFIIFILQKKWDIVQKKTCTTWTFYNRI